MADAARAMRVDYRRRRGSTSATWPGPGTSSSLAGSPRPPRPGSREPNAMVLATAGDDGGPRRGRCCARASTPAASSSTPTTPRPRATTCGSPASPRRPSPGTRCTGRCTCAGRRAGRPGGDPGLLGEPAARLAAGGVGVGAVDVPCATAGARRRAAAAEQRSPTTTGAAAAALGRLADRARAGGVLAGPGRPDARPAALRADDRRPDVAGAPAGALTTTSGIAQRREVASRVVVLNVVTDAREEPTRPVAGGPDAPDSADRAGRARARSPTPARCAPRPTAGSGSPASSRSSAPSCRWSPSRRRSTSSPARRPTSG